MDIDTIKSKVKDYIIEQLDIVSKSNPVIGFSKPIVKRIINNNINKYDKFIDLLKDENGNIDIQEILDEEISVLDLTDDFNFTIPIFGNCKIDKGVITLPIPLTDSGIKLNSEDLRRLKDLLSQ